MTEFFIRDTIPLAFMRIRQGVPVTGLTVTAIVKNIRTGATLLTSTTLTEQVSGSGLYSYAWAHGLLGETDCAAIYTVSGNQFVETFSVTDNEEISRAT